MPRTVKYHVDDKRSYGKPGKKSIPVKRKQCETDEKIFPSVVPGQPTDCADIQTLGANVSGVYAIYPGKHTNVYCDMETDGGGWTVFQRRSDGSVDFGRNWSDYKTGFGSISSEHWLGNDMIHQLSNQRNYELRVDLEDYDRNTRYANYALFRVDNETLGYKLNVSGYSGNAGDSLGYHSGQMFSTADNKNNGYHYNCGRMFNSGWWFKYCYRCNLNGEYRHYQGRKTSTGFTWGTWKTEDSCKMSEMKIRPTFEEQDL
ncbi:fibrinogen C domain-containing protein 1-like [Lytechinus variegatus]|uniref:fibrinogen C domain-containing protein 1-like n=1 Tax=Lytechinus variegatus TaxID=7654 RepID=UPI001BB12B6B|nr:fibrinogen C domain-containing protein 1-like [Lytechinus variegatus]